MLGGVVIHRIRGSPFSVRLSRDDPYPEADSQLTIPVRELLVPRRAGAK